MVTKIWKTDSIHSASRLQILFKIKFPWNFRPTSPHLSSENSAVKLNPFEKRLSGSVRQLPCLFLKWVWMKLKAYVAFYYGKLFSFIIWRGCVCLDNTKWFPILLGVVKGKWKIISWTLNVCHTLHFNEKYRVFPLLNIRSLYLFT